MRQETSCRPFGFVNSTSKNKDLWYVVPFFISFSIDKNLILTQFAFVPNKRQNAPVCVRMLRANGKRAIARNERRSMDDKKTKRKMLATDTSAVTALEYGIIASLLGLVLISTFSGLATTLSMLFSHVGGAV
jgi:Flp pilus assembly pilin Flp